MKYSKGKGRGRAGKRMGEMRRIIPHFQVGRHRRRIKLSYRFLSDGGEGGTAERMGKAGRRRGGVEKIRGQKTRPKSGRETCLKREWETPG